MMVRETKLPNSKRSFVIRLWRLSRQVLLLLLLLGLAALAGTLLRPHLGL